MSEPDLAGPGTGSLIPLCRRGWGVKVRVEDLHPWEPLVVSGMDETPSQQAAAIFRHLGRSG